MVPNAEAVANGISIDARCLASSACAVVAREGVLSDNGVLQMLRWRGIEAGIAGLPPHRFRHTYAPLMLTDGTEAAALAGR